MKCIAPTHRRFIQGCPHRRTCMGETARLPARGVNYDRPSLTLAADCRCRGIERPSSTPRRLNRAPLLTLVYFAGEPRRGETVSSTVIRLAAAQQRQGIEDQH